jgi:hypothetical protein
MGYIKEPEWVDFEINGKPLTEQQNKLFRGKMINETVF